MGVEVRSPAALAHAILAQAGSHFHANAHLKTCRFDSLRSAAARLKPVPVIRLCLEQRYRRIAGRPLVHVNGWILRRHYHHADEATPGSSTS